MHIPYAWMIQMLRLIQLVFISSPQLEDQSTYLTRKFSWSVQNTRNFMLESWFSSQQRHRLVFHLLSTLGLDKLHFDNIVYRKEKCALYREKDHSRTRLQNIRLLLNSVAPQKKLLCCSMHDVWISHHTTHRLHSVHILRSKVCKINVDISLSPVHLKIFTNSVWGNFFICPTGNFFSTWATFLFAQATFLVPGQLFYFLGNFFIS